MILTEFLTPDNIRIDVPASCKKRALEITGKMIAEAVGKQLPQTEEEAEELCPVACFTTLFKREKLGCTALNNGIAMPHAKLPSDCDNTLVHPIAVFMRLEHAIDYEAADKKEVDLIYAIMFPESTCATYKDRLPKIAEKLNDKNVIKQLRGAESTEEIWQIFKYLDNQQKAEHTEENNEA